MGPKAWMTRLRSLGQALVELWQAELDALGADLKGSARELLRAVLPPYAVSDPAAKLALAALAPAAVETAARRFAEIRCERDRMTNALIALPMVRRVWPGQGNFLLVEVDDRQAFVTACRDGNVLVRTLRGDGVMQNAVRITIGSSDDNDRLLDALGDAGPVRLSGRSGA